MKRANKIVLLVLCFFILFISVERIEDIPHWIHHFLRSSWETVAIILVIIGVVNSLSVILFVILNNVQKSTSKRFNYEKKILELKLKRNLLQKELSELNINEST